MNRKFVVNMINIIKKINDIIQRITNMSLSVFYKKISINYI